MQIYGRYNDIYLCLFAFESPRRTTFRVNALHILLKSLRNRGVSGGKNKFIVTKGDMGVVGVEKGVF